MPEISLLIADNNAGYLAALSEVFEEEEYSVFRAGNPEQVTEVLNSELIHIALLDLRMKNDHNALDKSGLFLAKNEKRLIPKIIMTNFPSVDDAVTALRLETKDLPYAVDFVSKRDGDGAIVKAVKRGIVRFVTVSAQTTFDLPQLRVLIDQGFSLPELKLLCFDLSINFEHLDGSGKETKILELILYVERRGLLNGLIEYCRQKRPFLAWSSISNQDNLLNRQCPNCGLPI